MRGIVLGALCLLVIAAGSAIAQTPAGPLGPERYAQIDAVYAATIPFEEDEVPASAVTAFLNSCHQLDRADPLRAALRLICLSNVRTIRAADALCGARKCSKLYRKLDKLDKQLSENIKRRRAANPVIFSQVRNAGCRAQLRTSAADLRDAERGRRALRLLARAVRSGSKADAKRAFKLLEDLGDETSATKLRARFQKACGPPKST